MSLHYVAGIVGTTGRHGHADHCFGIFEFDKEHTDKAWPLANVVAHANVAKRFDRYKLTLGVCMYVRV